MSTTEKIKVNYQMILSFIKYEINKHKKLISVIGAVCLLFMVLVVRKLCQAPTYSTNLSLIYQQASDGLNPNGTRFNPYLILSDEIIDPIEEELGVELDENIWIRPKDNAKGRSIATEYTISCGGLDACPVILNRVKENYIEFFESHYTMNDSILTYVAPDSNLDYIEIADYLEKEINKLNAFNTKQIKKDSIWYASDGRSYQDLLEYGENLLDIDLFNFRTFVTESGLTKNAKQIKRTFAYKNRLLLNNKAISDEQYKNRRDAITLYDPTLFPTISVPSIKDGEYYVTTTKTGLDYIYEAASTFSEQSYLLQRTISKNELLVRNMTETKTSAEAEKKLRDIERKIQMLISQTKELDEMYKEDKRTQYIVFSEVTK